MYDDIVYKHQCRSANAWATKPARLLVKALKRQQGLLQRAQNLNDAMETNGKSQW